jgi:L-alanine-DL-glutamate epimerase-like enolase superfamily enzyme
MLESALGRHALAAFAANDGVEITGDVSPSRRWLATDPWPDLKMSDGMIAVPTSPGVAPLPDQDRIEDLTIYRWTGSS